MKMIREFDIWLLAMNMRMKTEMYKKLKAYIRSEKPTTEEFLAYCDKELESIRVKYMKAVKEL